MLSEMNWQVEVVTLPLPGGGNVTHRTVLTPTVLLLRAIETVLVRGAISDTTEAAVLAAREHINSEAILREFTFRFIGLDRSMEANIALALGNLSDADLTPGRVRALAFSEQRKSDRAEGKSTWEVKHRSPLPVSDDHAGQAKLACVRCIRNTTTGVWRSSARVAWDATVDIAVACARVGLTDEETAVAVARSQGFTWRTIGEHLEARTGESWDKLRVMRIQRSLSRKAAVFSRAAARETTYRPDARSLGISAASHTIHEERLYLGGSTWVHNLCRDLEFTTRLLANAMKQPDPANTQRYPKAA
ncbi:MAG: hypothetical protein IT169_09095 [Bryobacterales bacterium]|nr:hypothetical protein [Bryobacterales bacterium]